MARLGVKLGARLETFYGLAGVGDVVTTCYSPYGRNRAVGERIGRGETLRQILSGMVNVAEGVPTTRSVASLARERGVEMPITTELHQVLFEEKPPRTAVVDLMLRHPKVERNG
jgi:glycerol-3-phosphate dehydrogenase (NAD(P)+)